MRAVVIHGSPRENGSTIKLTKSFIKGLSDKGCSVEFFDSTKLNIMPCTGCLKCESSGNCIFNDEMQHIYDSIKNTDIIILSSPVYFASFPSQIKAVMDRCQMLHSRRYKLGIENNIDKKGYLIFTAGGSNKKMIDSMELTARFFFLSCSAKLTDTIYVLNTDDKPVIDDEELFKKIYNKGFIAANNK